MLVTFREDIVLKNLNIIIEEGGYNCQFVSNSNFETFIS